MEDHGLDSGGSGWCQVVVSCINYVSFCHVVIIAYICPVLEGFQAHYTHSRTFQIRIWHDRLQTSDYVTVTF